jgi:diadenosine tetraphosphate (Ap4A) HIT family hydrolase
MSFHHDLEGWKRESEPEGCPFCRKPPAPAGYVDIKEFPTSMLGAQPPVCLWGTCCLIVKPHAVELFDLNDADLLSYMKEAQVSAKALKTVTNAVKTNYEIHGNTEPHMRMHVFPRYVDDPFPGKSIDFARVEPAVYKTGEFEAFIARMRDELDEDA